MRTLRLSLWAITLGISVLGFSQTKGKAFFQHEKTVQNTTFKRSSAGWNDTKNVRLQWIGTKLQHIEGYKSSIPQKQANAAAQPNRHKAAKQQLDSIVGPADEKTVYKYDANGNNVIDINYYLDVEQGRNEYAYDAKGNLIMEIYYDHGVQQSRYEYAYDAAENQTMYAYYQWDGTAWKGNSKDSSVYDANKNLLLRISYVWSDSSGNWEGGSKQAYKYDANGNQTEQITYQWDGSDWVEDLKEEIIYYNTNGDVLFDYSYQWSGTAWDTTSKIEAIYNIDGLLEKMFQSEWDADSAEWMYYKAEYTYDIDGNLETGILSEWDGTNWINNARLQFAYDANKNQTLFAYYSWNGTDWVGSFKDSLEYDAAGNQILRISYGWNDVGNDWIAYEKYENAYDSNKNQTMSAYYSWDGTDWVGYFKDSSEYDADGNLLMEASFQWESGVWTGSKYEYEYDMSYSKADLIFPSIIKGMNNKRLKGTFSWSDGTTWTEEESENMTYYWGDPKVAGIAEAETNNASVKIYPNPVSSQLHINLNAQESADYAIYTITGQMITSGKLQNTSIIDVESLSNGMYYLKISGKENRTLKIIKN